MKLNNSIKLAMANFSLFWKILVYKIASVGIIILMLLPVWAGLSACLESSGFFDAFTNLFSASIFQNMTNVTLNLFACFDGLVKAVGIFASTNVVSTIYVIMVVFVFAPFILKLSDVPTSETVYCYMSSLNRNSFTVNFLDGFGKSAGYSILKTLLEIPFWLLTFAGAYGILSWAVNSEIMQILSPLILFAFVVFMIGLKTTLLSGWCPSIVVFNTCAGRAFGRGIKAVKRKFLSTLSSFAVVVTIMFAIIYMFGIYSLVVVLPLSSLITSVFGQVLFFESQGMNYYISPDKIVMPRKLEQADNMKKMKSII